MKAMTTMMMLAGCGMANVSMAHSFADDVVATLEWMPAGFQATTDPPAIGEPRGDRPSLDVLLSPYRISSSILDPDWLQDRRLLDPANAGARGLGLDYGWRNMKLEGAVVRVRESEDLPLVAGRPNLMTTTASRLSYRASSNLTLQIVRGHVTRHGLADSGDEARRALLSAIYRRPFLGNDWQMILAAGRNTGPVADSTSRVYLLESSTRIANEHTVFARIERASAGELFTERDALYGQDFNANRVMLGYVRATRIGEHSLLSFGSVVFRRSLPQTAATVLGRDAPAYKVFVRLSLQMP